MDRRKFLKTSALVAGFVIGSGGSGVMSLRPELTGAPNLTKDLTKEGKISDLSVKALSLRITCITEIIHPPKGGTDIRIWIPLPRSDQEQELTGLTVDSPGAFQIHEEPLYGNQMIYLDLSRANGGEKIAITYKIRRERAGTIEDKGEDIKRHLFLTEREKWDQRIVQFADDLVGAEKDPYEIGKKIYYALIDYLTYDREIPGCGQGISVWIFGQRRGKCDDFHALFRTLMVYKGIPVRWEQGISLPYPSVMTGKGEFEGDCTGAHCWVRFYAGDGRWVPADVSEGNKRKDLRDYFFGTLSPNRFKVSTGRDILLKPPQSGDPLNTFPFAYGESDEVPLIYGHHYRNLIRYEVLDMERTG